MESGYRDRPIVLQGWHRLVESGGFGVYVFFCLSGYLLFRPFVRQAWGDGGQVSLRRYAVNRALRILPLYYVVFLVYVFIRQGGGTFGTWWRFLLVLPNYHVQTLRLVDGGMWSIVDEVEFYIVLPLIAWLLVALAGRSLRAATVLLASAGVLLYLLHYVTVNDAANPSRSWIHSLPATFVFFVPGMLLALLHQHLRDTRPAWWRGPLAYADTWIAAAVAVGLLVAYKFGWSGRDGLIMIGAFLLLAGAALPLIPGVFTRILDWRPLAVLGLASYSLYLWHGPIVLKLGEHLSFVPLELVSLAICIPIALLSFRLIETPFLRLRTRWQGSPTASTSQDSGTFVATAADVGVSD
jgi:peptidoglycan/LPS O-acetylase OafA/YrhL